MADYPALVIFDCDGVLVDSERIAVRLESQVLTELGWPLSPEEVAERFLGRTDAYMHAEIVAHLGDRLPDGWQEEFHKRYVAAFDAELDVVDGIREALAEITAPTCVASSGSHEKMRRTLGKTGLYDQFAGRIFSALDVEHGKPAPDLFLYAAERMGAEPGDCAVVEDSPFGVQAARAAGMRAFGFAGGITPARWLEGPGTVVFDDMRQLPALLAGRR